MALPVLGQLERRAEHLGTLLTGVMAWVGFNMFHQLIFRREHLVTRLTPVALHRVDVLVGSAAVCGHGGHIIEVVVAQGTDERTLVVSKSLYMVLVGRCFHEQMAAVRLDTSEQCQQLVVVYLHSKNKGQHISKAHLQHFLSKHIH